jgi:hypothetical protein
LTQHPFETGCVAALAAALIACGGDSSSPTDAGPDAPVDGPSTLCGNQVVEPGEDCEPTSGAVMTFEGLRDSEKIAEFYAGGLGRRDSGPGPSFGVTFGGSALAVMDSDDGGSGDFGGEPSPRAIMLLANDVAPVMNVPSGFSGGLSFYYSAATEAGIVRVFSGVDGLGDELATLVLTTTPADGQPDPTGMFSPLLPLGTAFAGTAHSVDFSGAIAVFAFDNLTLGSATPHPGDTTGICFANCSLVAPACGDGRVDPGEECDDRGNSAGCNADCSALRCGDGYVNPVAEACDDGFADACGSCNQDCTGSGAASTCGDSQFCPETEGVLTTLPGVVAASSGGGAVSSEFGPSRMIDGSGQAQCALDGYHWILASDVADGSWIEVGFPQPVTISRIAVDTLAATADDCDGAAGRNVAGAEVQWYSGSQWVTADVISGQTDDWEFSFPSPVTTTRVRLYNVVTSSVGQALNPIIFEFSAFGCDG